MRESGVAVPDCAAWDCLAPSADAAGAASTVSLSRRLLCDFRRPSPREKPPERVRRREPVGRGGVRFSGMSCAAQSARGCDSREALCDVAM
jgi:hypothetical protein